VPRPPAQRRGSISAGSRYLGSRRPPGSGPNRESRPRFFQSDAGVYTLVGDGVDVWSPTSNCVFAGSPSTAQKAQFTCRVTGLANVDCPQPSDWVKVGLMAAADLSDTAPALTLEVTGAHGSYSQSLAAWYSGWVAGAPGAATEPGLLPSSGLTLDLKKPAANYLAHPVWLRLTRDGISWTFASSTDGGDLERWRQDRGPDGRSLGGVVCDRTQRRLQG